MIQLVFALLALQGPSRWPYDQFFGSCVANAGDVDGDRDDDLLIGNLGAPGTVWILSSRTWKPVLTACGAVERDGFGGSAKRLGDVDADGQGDFLVGPWRNYDGSISVRSGKDGSQLASIEGGSSVSYRVFDDVDGDRVPDVLVIGDGFGDWSPTPCRARFHSSKNGSVLARVQLGADDERVDCLPIRLQDEDGDGRSEWAYTVRKVVTNESEIRLVSGRDWKLLRAIPNRLAPGAKHITLECSLDDRHETEPLAVVSADYARAGIVSLRDGQVKLELGRTVKHFGVTSVAVLDGVDRDARADLLVASEHDGLAEGSVRLVSGVSGEERATVKVPQSIAASCWHFGSTLCVLGDIDADGVRDFVAGVDNSRSPCPGAVFAFSGRTSAMLLEFRRHRDSVSVRRHGLPNPPPK